MKRSYLFIDDSGDTGFKKSATSHFLIAALLVIDEEQKLKITEAIDLFRRNLGWNELHEIKFNKAEKGIVIDFIDFVKEFDYSAYIMVLDKTKINPEKIPKSKVSLYFQIIKELLLKLELTNPIITIDGRADKKFAKEIKTYLRQSLRENGVYDSRIYLVDSRKNSLIQLTDIVVGSVARSYRKEKTDSQTYIEALGDKIVGIYDFDF
jgi:hypothetical protein